MEAQLAAITAQLSKLDKIDTIVTQLTQLNQNVSEMKTTIFEQEQKIENWRGRILLELKILS